MILLLFVLVCNIFFLVLLLIQIHSFVLFVKIMILIMILLKMKIILFGYLVNFNLNNMATKIVFIVEELDKSSMSFTSWLDCQKYIYSRLPYCRVLQVFRKSFLV